MIDGEPILWRGNLSDRWKCYRCVTCCCVASWLPASFGLPLIGGLAYLICGNGARSKEFASFDLAVTPTAIHHTQKLYACGCCCQVTQKKAIPLDKVQDVALVADCCGDTCGYTAEKGKPYKGQIETAGSGNPKAGPELTVVCLEDLEGFRSAVLAAKRRLLAGGGGLPVAAPYTGADKSVQLVASGPEALMARAAATVPSAVASASGGAGGAGGDSAEIVAALHRIERTLQEGVAMMAARPAGGMTMGAHAGSR